MNKANLLREISELRKQLSYSKNLGFYFGAGTSCALKIPNVFQLTDAVESKLNDEFKKAFLDIKTDISADLEERAPNIEDILNQIRRIRDITCEKPNKEYLGISGDLAKKLDSEICVNIYKIILEKENDADLKSPIKFFAWLSLLNRDFTKEIFTSNYDLIFEKALEASQIPYFDGFIGSYEPFFWQESIDHMVTSNDLTKDWIRLWKIHGSLSWFWKKNEKNNSNKIIRIGKVQSVTPDGNELVIYPSKEKYDTSRKQPFIAYFDRLKNYLLSGELLFIVSGYSFSDQHINDVIFNCLRENNRLFCIVYFFKDDEVTNLHNSIPAYMNLSVYGPSKGILNGNLVEWEFDESELNPNEQIDHFYDKENNQLSLGDFNSLVDFLIKNSGIKETIESSIK